MPISWNQIITAIYIDGKRARRALKGVDSLEERLFGQTGQNGCFFDQRRGAMVEAEIVETEEAVQAYLVSGTKEDLIEAILEIADFQVQRQIILFFREEYTSTSSPEEVNDLVTRIENQISIFLKKIGFTLNEVDPVMRAKYSVRATGRKDKKMESSLALEQLEKLSV